MLNWIENFCSRNKNANLPSDQTFKHPAASLTCFLGYFIIQFCCQHLTKLFLRHFSSLFRAFLGTCALVFLSVSGLRMKDLNARTWLLRRNLKRTNFWEVNFGRIFDGFCLRSRIIWLRSVCVLIKVATLRQRKKRQIILMSCGTVSTRLKQSRACNLLRKKILSGGIIKKYVCDCLTFSYEPANHSGRKHSHILWLPEDIQSFFEIIF